MDSNHFFLEFKSVQSRPTLLHTCASIMMRTFLSLPVMLLATVATAAAAAQSSIAVAPFINTTVQRRMRREEEDVHKMINEPPHEETLILDKKNDVEEEREQKQHFEKTSCVWSDLTHSIPIVDDGSVTFDYELIRLTKPNAMLCGRLTVDISDEYYTNLLLNESTTTTTTTTTVGWIGIAISPEEGVMNDSIAIIGLLPTTTSTSNDDHDDDPKQKNSAVQMYEISRSEWRGIATPMIKKYQTLTETSITLKEYIYAGVSKRLAVMTFGILLDVKQNNEKEDLSLAGAGGDEQQQQEEKEVSIKEHGMNYFIFKQGMTTNELTTDGGSIPFNDANSKFTIFTKDFDDDITVVSIITLTLASCQGLLCDLRVSYSPFSSNICFSSSIFSLPLTHPPLPFHRRRPIPLCHRRDLSSDTSVHGMRSQ